MKEIILEVQELYHSGHSRNEILKITGITEYLLSQIETVYLGIKHDTN